MASNQHSDGHEKGKSSDAAADAAGSDPSDAEFKCPICFERPGTSKDVAAIGGCAHRFCFDCIDRWSRTKTDCPICKKPFETISCGGVERKVDGGTSGGNQSMERFESNLYQLACDMNHEVMSWKEAVLREFTPASTSIQGILGRMEAVGLLKMAEAMMGQLDLILQRAVELREGAGAEGVDPSDVRNLEGHTDQLRANFETFRDHRLLGQSS